MPPRKAEHIVQVLRQEILSGQRAPGAKLPTYDAIVEQFGVTRPTVARGLKALRSEGLVTADGTRGVFVATTFPHHNRYLWITSERPGSSDWSSVSATILELIERGETGVAGELVPLVGVDGRANNPAYQALCEAVAHGSAAGLILTGSPTTSLLPVLQAPGLPRVALGAPLPHAALLGLDVAAFVARAAVRLVARARRIAVFSPHAAHLALAEERLVARGADKKLLSMMHVAPVGCETLTRLLFERPDRPEAVFVTDDSLVAPLLAGLTRAKVRPRRDVHVLAHCQWPRPVGAAAGVEHLGFDAREILAMAKRALDAQRAGGAPAGALVPPRLASELSPLDAREAPAVAAALASSPKVGQRLSPAA
jgi:DNA-binding transcriptional ArsR family regulator